jgi:hypothetical protein
MANGRQIGDENVQTFLRWMVGKTDPDYRAMALRGVLSRKEIAKECGFAKSALDQNPRIKAALRQLEKELRERGVLPPEATKDTGEPQALRLTDRGGQRARLDAERLKRLEQENASLRAENTELKRLLGQHAMLSEALALTGRLPR